MHDSVRDFAQRVLSPEAVGGARVLAVGSYNVNGSLRARIEAACASYLGVDMREGPEVDVVRDACVPGLCDSVDGPFDLVVCTEMLEHAENWRAAVENIKECVVPGGLVLLTTRSKGFALHDYPSDYWRFELQDMRRIFADFKVLTLEQDPEAPGVFVLAMKVPGRAPVDLTEIEPHAMRLSVVTWKWGTVFGPEYVNRLRNMMARNFRVPHRFLCVTDDPRGLDPGVSVVDPSDGFDDLGLWLVDEKMGGSACLRRLKQYDRAAAARLGSRFLSIDLDLVVVDDVTPLFDRPEPLVLMNWTYTGGTVYGGGIVLCDAGAVQPMWDRYRANPAGYGEASRGADSLFIARRNAAAAAARAVEERQRAQSQAREIMPGMTYQFISPPKRRERPDAGPRSTYGPPSDQSVLNYYLQRSRAVPASWSTSDGIVRYFTGSRAAYGPPIEELQRGVRIVVFGHDDKDVMETYKHGWIREHWR